MGRSSCFWYDGGLLPPTPPGFPPGLPLNPEGGALFVGARGMLMHETYGERPMLIGEGLNDIAKAVPQSLPRIQGGLQGHEMNWVRAIRGEEAISCPFQYAAPLVRRWVLEWSPCWPIRPSTMTPPPGG